MDTVTIADLSRVIDQFSLRDRAIIELLLSSGMPIDVLLSINIEHYAEGAELHLAAELIHSWHIENEKTGIQYVTFSSSETTNSIMRYLYYRILCTGVVYSDDPLFADELGNRLCKETINSIFRRLSSATGKSVTPHQLRKLFSKTLYDNGAEPSFIREILGHYVAKYYKVYYDTDDIETIIREVQETMTELTTTYMSFEGLLHLENDDYVLNSAIISEEVQGGD